MRVCPHNFILEAIKNHICLNVFGFNLVDLNINASRTDHTEPRSLDLSNERSIHNRIFHQKTESMDIVTGPCEDSALTYSSLSQHSLLIPNSPHTKYPL